MRASYPARGALTLAVSLAVVLAAGCGSSSSSGGGVASKSPVQIVQAAKVAASSAVSTHVTGSIVSDGKPISLDMELFAGKGGKGKVTLEGLSVRLIAIGDEIYVNGSAPFYKRLADGAAARLLQGKWLKVPTDSGDFGSFAKLTNLDEFVGSTLASHGELSSAGRSTIDGVPAVGVTDRTRQGTLYVAATGTPYPLEIVRRGANGGTLSFGDWNKPVTLTPPAHWININRLKDGG